MLMRLICVLSLFVSLSASGQYHNLVFEGGGIRGIAYAGAVKALEEQHVLGDVKVACGTSVGAITAGLLAVGYTADEMALIMEELEIQQFNDGQWFFIGGVKRMTKNYGWYKGEKLERWMGKLIEAKTGNVNLTLKQLHQLAETNTKYRDLYTLAANLSLQRREVLSYLSYPDMPVKTAIRISISIPLYFGAVFVDSAGNTYKQQDKAGSYMVMVDGGLVANYPLTLFDSGSINAQTLGFKLERPEQIAYAHTAKGLAPYHINNTKAYIAALYNIAIEQLNPLTAGERARTIYISTGNISPRVRRIAAADKKLLYENGKSAARDFIEKR
ncbi:MAG: patatin [Sphingobacteriales bacterium]|nr:MAG: patatin [Sphingobacteriales bacterium]